MRQQLSLYRLPSTWDPGSIFIVRTLWFCLFGPITALRFLPGSFWFSLKICVFVVLFVWMRAALPRYRYDQLMNLGWKVFLPASLGYLILTFCVLISFNMLPY